MTEYKTLKQGQDIFEKSVLLIKDENGYSVYQEKTHYVFEYGSCYMTAEKHYNQLIEQ